MLYEDGRDSSVPDPEGKGAPSDQPASEDVRTSGADVSRGAGSRDDLREEVSLDQNEVPAASEPGSAVPSSPSKGSTPATEQGAVGGASCIVPCRDNQDLRALAEAILKRIGEHELNGLGRLAVREGRLGPQKVAEIVDEDLVVDLARATDICDGEGQVVMGAIVLALAEEQVRRQDIESREAGADPGAGTTPRELAGRWGFSVEIERYLAKLGALDRVGVTPVSANVEISGTGYKFSITHIGGDQVQIEAADDGESLGNFRLSTRSRLAKKTLSLELAKLGLPGTAGVSKQAIYQVLAKATKVVLDALCPVHGEDAETRADEFLESTELTRRLLEDMTKVGFQADPEVGLALYLCKISALHDEPVYVYLVGPASSLKTYYADRTAELTPDGMLKHITDLTQKALYYGATDLSNHIIVLDEMDLQGGGQALDRKVLRMLFSKGWCEIETTLGGKSRRKRIQGPVMVIQTTVATSFDEQDLSRHLLIDLPDCPDRTDTVLGLMGQQYAGRTNQEEVDRVKDMHRAVHLMLPKGTPIHVPFAPALAKLMPRERIVVLRTFRTIMSLIKAHALLHFRQRRPDAEGRILATMDDYRVVFEHAGEFISQSMGAFDVPTPALDWVRSVLDGLAERALARAHAGELQERKLLARMKGDEKEFLDHHRRWDEGLPLDDLVRLTGRPRSTVQRYLEQLQKAGLVERETAGRMFHYLLATPDGVLPTCPRLPSPDDVEREHLGTSTK